MSVSVTFLNSDWRSRCHASVGDVEVSLSPAEERTFELASGSHVAIWWKNGYGERNYMVNNAIFVSGKFEITAPLRPISPPRLEFTTAGPHSDGGDFLEEQYRLVGEAAAAFSKTTCYQNGCPCLGGDAQEPETLSMHLQHLCDRGVCTAAQLNQILDDMF